MAASRPRGGFLARMAATAAPPISTINHENGQTDSSSSEVVQPNSNETNGEQRRSSISQSPNEPYRGRSNHGNFQRGGSRYYTNRGQYHQSGSNNRFESATTTSRTQSNRPNSNVRINYGLLVRLAEKVPDEILSELLHRNFPLTELLNDSRMQNQFDWVFQMTKILERVTKCEGAEERISMVLSKIAETKYVDGIYALVRQRDLITDEPRYDLLQSFLKMFDRLLALIPYSSGDLVKVSERIELIMRKTSSDSPAHQETETILDEVLERLQEVEKRAERNNKQKRQYQTNGNNTIGQDIGLPPDNYRELSIIPDVREILSEKRPYLRANIVDGIYQNPEHYLDVHFRLLREDFVGPLREGIQQYKSGSQGRNFNVRIYENVRVLGSRLSAKSGIVFDLHLDPTTASKISWVNSRRLIYGNLLLLTFGDLEHCAFVTVEDRSNVEKSFIISVQPLDVLNNAHEMQISLDDINLSYSLIMIETMTYFEAYRPVLNALQIIPTDDTFPLEPYLLRLTNADDPPSYIDETTTYDFTPLLVDPKSEVKAVTSLIETNDREIGRRGIAAAGVAPLAKEFSIRYQQANQIPGQYKRVQLLKEDQWPSSDALHLNPKQREALILALTHKVALIQGPPGTGKTFLGVRIAEMLLHNRSVWCPRAEQSTPILMICHTNHALDQFLELIKNRLNLTEGIIRVGNRCQNPSIQPFALTYARRYARDHRSIPREIYHQKHVILDRKTNAEENLKFHNDKYQKSCLNILPLWTLIESNVINDDHISSLTAYNMNVPDDSVLFNWLDLGNIAAPGQDDIFSSIEEEQLQNNKQIGEVTDENNTEPKNNDDDDEETNTDDADDNENNQNGTNQLNLDEEEEEELRRRNELDEENDFIPSLVHKPQQQTTAEFSYQTIQDDYDDGEGAWQVVGKSVKKIRRLIKYIIEHPTTLSEDAVNNIQVDLWNLSLAERFDLYRFWLLKYRMTCQDATREARQEYNRAIAALAEYHREEDYYLLKDSVIVAMTTTGAARYHSVLEKLQSKIVIVEEAAAIFEAHIITSLSTKCEHLILIGDHVQLRPNPSVYKLAVKYQLEVSLFERLIKNQFPNVRLNIQHRMRPEIARLMKHFYDDLEDHESVKTDRPGIRAVDCNVYFIKHSNREIAVADGSSKRNEFEANYVIQLALYLVKQGYQTAQITILVMYLGQRQYIARKTKDMALLRGLKITVTDNYQGEENDIILLSLVRSNPDKKAGFLKIQNRICVALSRARCGLFIIGDMNMLAEVDEMWKKIGKSLNDHQALGQGLGLSCNRHSKEKFIADTPESFAKRPEGGCNKPCIARLECGHQCELMCHNYDPEHKDVVCHKKCPTILSCSHQCSKRCHAKNPDQHNPCRILVDKTIATCQHSIKFQCAQTPKPFDCKVPVLKVLSCDHANQIPCGIVSSPSELRRFCCQTLCNENLACTHKCVGNCGKCRSGQLHIPCQAKCERPLVCGHICRSPCAATCPPCTQPCQTRCVHSQCKKNCGELCVPCKEPCAYKCKHLKCTRLCSEPCNRGPCNEPCEKKLKCGHDCIGICGEPCPNKCRVCNAQIVREIFFGTEDEPDAQFVQLPDCQHLLEISGLDRCVLGTPDEPKQYGAIHFPECPKCKTPIRRCIRYMPTINQIHNHIEKVKQKILGYQSVDEIKEKRKALQTKYETTIARLVEVSQRALERHFSPLLLPDSFISNDSLVLMENILSFITAIEKILVDGRKRLSFAIFEERVMDPLNFLTRYLLSQHVHRNFAEQQIQDIQAELNRIQCVIYFEAFQQTTSQSIVSRALKPDEQAAMDQMQYLTKKKGQFTNNDKQKFDGLMKKLEKLLNLPGLGITETERVSIVKALQMGAGHWYICPKGHPYVITECGGANQTSKCPDCGEAIGGENHRLIGTNRHFGLMDGSQHAAWSNEANMNMIP